MRKHQVVKIDDKEITVKELRVKDIVEIFNTGDNTTDIMGKITALLPRFTDGIAPDDLQDMAPSEIKALYDVFKEVNAVFFDLALEMGLAELIVEIKKSIQTEFSEAFASSFKRAT